MFLVHKLNKINLFSNSPPSIIYNKDNKIIINKIYKVKIIMNIMIINKMKFKISKALNNNQKHNKNLNLKILNLI